MDLNQLTEHARSPWFLVPICIGIGGGAVVLLTGVPALSTEAAATWFGGMGGWLGALATFMAVLLPYKRERRRAKFRARLALGNVMKNLNHLRRQLDNISSVRYSLAGGDYHMPRPEVDVVFSLNFQIPVIEPEPEMEAVIQATEGLRADIESWARLISTFAFGPDARLSPRQVAQINPMLDSLTARLEVHISRLAEVIAEADPVLGIPRRPTA